MPVSRGLTVGWQPLLLAAALGLLHAATFAPWGSWWTQLAVLTVFAALILSMIRRRRSLRSIALTGLVFGFGWFTAGVGWIYVSMHTYGLMPAPLALLALLLFAIYLGIFPAAAAWATAKFATCRPHGILAFPFVFAAAFLPAGYLVGAAAWALHLAVDRVAGYGLRTPDGFQRA